MDKKHETMVYMTRNLRKDLHEQLRVLAAIRREKMEHIVNWALEIGLNKIERELDPTTVERVRSRLLG